MIYVKIRKDATYLQYIKLLRTYDNTLSIAGLKKAIEEYNVVLGYDDTFHYDFCDDINELDRNQCFLNLIYELITAGAEIELFQDDKLISLQLLHNRISTLKEIDRQVQLDMDREVGEIER